MVYRFDDFEVNPHDFSLKRSETLVTIEPKVFDVIFFLVENAGRVITRQAFFDHVWAGSLVSDATLSNHIKLARAALGDDAQTQKVIKTVHGRGYQFVAELRTQAEPDLNRQATSTPNPSLNSQIILDQKPQEIKHLFSLLKTKRIILVALTFLAIGICGFLLVQKSAKTVNHPHVESTSTQPSLAKNGRRSIAILPFKNLSLVNEDQHFVDGIHGDLLTKISKLENVKTISLASVRQYRNSNLTPTKVASELNVASVLQGTVQRSGEQVRINSQLIDSKTGEQLWAESYTRALNAKNIFAIQDEIALAISAQLDVALTPQRSEFPTENLQALEAYYQATSFMLLGTNNGNALAIRYFESAIEQDPGFSIAHAELARLHLNQIYRAGLPTNEQILKAKPLINQALKLDAYSSEAYAALAVLYKYQLDYRAAEEAFREAIRINPNNGIALSEYGQFTLWNQARYAKAIDILERHAEIDPNDNYTKINLIWAYISVGDFEASRLIADKLIIRNPDFAPAYRAKSDWFYWRGNHLADAQKYMSMYLKRDPLMPFNSMLMSTIYIMSGDEDLALKWLQHAIDLAPNTSIENASKMLFHQLNGQTEEALELALRSPIDDKAIPALLWDTVSAGTTLGRMEEVEAFYLKFYPHLFNEGAQVDASNFIHAVAVARIMNWKGHNTQSRTLLKACLDVVSYHPYGGWITKESDWRTRILILLGDHERALEAFSEYVDSGYGSKTILKDPIYKPLHGYPKFEAAKHKMNGYLAQTRKRLRQMESSGEVVLPP